MNARISLFWDDDETVVGKLEALMLTHIPKAGDEIHIVASGNSETQALTAVRIRHTLVFEFMGDKEAPFQQVDIFVKAVRDG